VAGRIRYAGWVRFGSDNRGPSPLETTVFTVVMLAYCRYGAIGLCAKTRRPRKNVSKDGVTRRGTLSKGTRTNDPHSLCDRKTMLRFFLWPVLARGFCFFPWMQQATERMPLAMGRLSPMTPFAEFRDRERTGSYVSSRVWGQNGQVRLPRPLWAVDRAAFGGRAAGPREPASPAPGSALGRCVVPAVGAHAFRTWTAVEYSVGAAILPRSADPSG